MKRLTVILLSLTLLLSGCGVLELTRLGKDLPSNVEATKEPRRTKEPKPTEEPTPEPMIEETPSPERAEYEVINNGSDFVSIDGKVYFRKIGKYTYYDDGLFGNFIGQAAVSEDSVIVSYDPETGEVTEEFDDEGFGPLYFMNGYLYMNKMTDFGRDCVTYRVNIETKLKEDLYDGYLKGVDPYNDTSIAMTYDDDDNHEIAVYNGDRKITTLYPSDDYENIDYLGADEGTLFFISYRGNMDKYEVYEYSEPDGLTLIGDIPAYSDDDLLWTPDDFLKIGDEVYILMKAFDGSAHFWQSQECYQYIQGEEGSLYLYCEEGDDPMASESKLTEDDGVIAFYKHVPGDVFLDDESKDLNYIDEYGYEDTAVRDFIGTDDQKSLFKDIFQAGAHIDGTTYAIKAMTYRDPGNDIGWREAYQCIYMDYIAVNEFGEEIPLVKTVKESNSLECYVRLMEDQKTIVLLPVLQTGDMVDVVSARAYTAVLSDDCEFEYYDEKVGYEDGDIDDFYDYLEIMDTKPVKEKDLTESDYGGYDTSIVEDNKHGWVLLTFDEDTKVKKIIQCVLF